MINLSTCSAEITDILLSSLSFKGISRPPCGTNYAIVRMWICGIMTFHIEYTMYIVYCACIFGLEAIINGKRSESQSVTYSYKYFCIEWQKCSNSNIRNNQMKLTWIYVCVLGQRYWLLEFENLLSIWFLSPRLTFTQRQLNLWSESESHPCYTKWLKPSWQAIVS